VLTVPEHLPRVKALLTASFETIELRSATDRSLERRAQMDNGRDFLDSLTPERVAAVAGATQCLRIYRPAGPHDPADTEIGWSVVSTHRAPRDVINAPNPTDPEHGEDPAAGILVYVRGRVALAPDRALYQDFDIRYWIALDQSEESWSVRATTRQRQASTTDTETGIRNPPSAAAPRPVLTVIQSSERTGLRQPYDWEVPDVYLSQALTWLVGRLLPRDSAEPTEFAYYVYNNRGDQPRITLRLDQWAPATGGSDRWILSTRLGSDATPIVTTYDPDGTLLRQQREDGALVEPADPQSLKRLWRSKGLDPGGGS
jgi:hypothetical protein